MNIVNSDSFFINLFKYSIDTPVLTIIPSSRNFALIALEAFSGNPFKIFLFLWSKVTRSQYDLKTEQVHKRQSLKNDDFLGYIEKIKNIIAGFK